jgi:hypothetical protein
LRRGFLRSGEALRLAEREREEEEEEVLRARLRLRWRRLGRERERERDALRAMVAGVLTWCWRGRFVMWRTRKWCP